jgi:hypothetical protein
MDMEKQMEEWRDVVGFEGVYQASNWGNVKRLSRNAFCGIRGNVLLTEKILQLCKHNHGYLVVGLSRNKKARNYFVHRLVAEAFISNPESKKEVNHINADKADNRVENLEWATRKENHRHAELLGLNPMGDNHKSSKLTSSQVIEIVNSKGKCGRELAKKFGVSYATISLAKNKKTWKHLHARSEY